MQGVTMLQEMVLIMRDVLFQTKQNLTGTYLPNSNLSFTGFIKVIFDKSIMMNSKLSNGNFPESSFIRANLYEAVLEGGNFEKN